MIDLHIHTTASSDGQYTPQEIFNMAKEKGIKALAFADHNSIENIEEGIILSRLTGIDFIPCVEFNSLFKGDDLHILGYFIEYTHDQLKSWLEEIQEQKKIQAKKRIEKLRALGFVFSEEDVERFSKGKIPTGVSFLKAILSRVENQDDPRVLTYIKGERSGSPYVNFYLDYLSGGKPAFVPLNTMETGKVIEKIRELKGIPVLAHPKVIKEEEIIELISKGLCGLEVYSSYHTPEQERYFQDIVEKYGLIATAGSDFHGEKVKPDVQLGDIRGNEIVLVERLRDLKEKLDRIVL